MYNFNHLYYFYITVKSGGVTSAAEHLHISQPSLSSQLKVLEDSLETKLFSKVGRSNKLTQEGTVVYGFCRQMFELSEEMHELVTKRVPHASRRIYIGVANEIANSFAVEVVSAFLKQHTESIRPKVILITGSHTRLVEQLRFREIDVLISQQATTNFELQNIVGAEIPVNLFCSYSNKLLPNKKYSSVADIIKSLGDDREPEWVLPSPGFKLRAETDQFFELNSIKGRIVFESDVMATILRSILDEIGMAFIPLVYIPKEMNTKSLRRFGPKNGYWTHRIWLACHTQNKDDHLVKSVAQAFIDVFKPLIA